MVDRLERRSLRGQAIDQFMCINAGKPRNVEDRLFRIERHALPADDSQGIERVAFQPYHAELEYLKQPHRSGTDNGDIGPVRRCNCGMRHKSKHLCQTSVKGG